jgi:hypothetical protein
LRTLRTLRALWRRSAELRPRRTPHAFHVSGTNSAARRSRNTNPAGDVSMNGLIYLIGLIVVIMAVLSFFGLR